MTLVALLASPIVLWLDPWVWGFPTIYFLVSANVAVVVYLYFTIFSYIFLLFSVVSRPGRACSVFKLGATCVVCWRMLAAGERLQELLQPKPASVCYTWPAKTGSTQRQ